MWQIYGQVISIYSIDNRSIYFFMLSGISVNMKRYHFYIDLYVISPKFLPYDVHGACAALAYLCHNVFETVATKCINANAFLIQLKDSDHLLIMT